MAKINKKQADAALRDAYGSYNELLARYCRVRLREAPDAVDDCIQNTYLAYYKRLLSGEEIKNPKAFLYRTADNMIKRAAEDYYKNAKRHTDLTEADKISVYDSFEENIFAQLDYDRLKEILISRLSEEEQRLYQMKYADGKSLKEIGDELGIAPAAVANRTSRLRSKIKPMIKEVIENEVKGGRSY